MAVKIADRGPRDCVILTLLPDKISDIETLGLPALITPEARSGAVSNLANVGLNVVLLSVLD